MRVNVEVAMREKGLGWILREVAGDRQVMATKNGEEMDVDEPQKSRTQEQYRPFNPNVR